MMDAIREQRIENYRVKKAAKFKCAKCNATTGILVVTTAEGGLSTRCEKHVGLDGSMVTLGQWREAEKMRAEMAAKMPKGRGNK